MKPAVLIILTLTFLGGLSSLAEEKPFYQTLKPPPAPELSPTEALAAFAVAPGFNIELVAAEPLVEDPVAITWDEAGSLYVVEMRGFMPDAWGNGEKEPVGSVVRLDDIDDDGYPDRRTVLLNGLVLPRAIAIVNQGLLIGEPPYLWLCPGKTITITCRNKISLGEYGNQPGSVEHAENKLLIGLDNWIYSAKSDRRMQVVDDQLISEPTLFRGQWGMTQDNLGNLYYNTNSNLLLGDLYDAQPVIAAGNQRAPGLNDQISKDDQLFAVRVNPGVNRAYVPGVLREDGRLNKPTSASGMVAYRGSQFPGSFSNRVFVAEPAANAVVELALTTGELTASTEHKLYPDETWQQREFLASTDERFRPVDLSIGPDGALYVIDMYRGIIQDHVFLTDQLREQALSRGLDKPVGMGRIWRVSAINGSPADQTIPDDDEALVTLLGHENSWQRETAQRLLVARQGKQIDQQLQRLIKGDNPIAAVHALWTLQGRNQLTPEAVEGGLQQGNPEIQLAALRAGHEQLDVSRLLELAEATDRDLAHHATLYLQPHNHEDSVISFLVAAMDKRWQDAIQRTGIRSAAAGNEMALIDQLIDQWSATAEAETDFIKQTFRQALRGSPEKADSYLDKVLDSKFPWQQEAMLAGLQEVSNDDGFQRVELVGPHSIFSEPPVEIWPAIAKARRAFTWQGDELAASAIPLSPAERTMVTKGRNYYMQRCSICHGNDGRGIAALGPPLAESDWVTGPTERLIRIVLHGLQGEIEVQGETWNGVMPGHAAIPEFDDATAAGLMTYLHRAWGHSGRIIAPPFVAEVRQLEAGRETLWTAMELEEIDVNTHYRQFAGTYGGGQFTLEITYNGSQLEISSVFFNGLLEEQDEGQFLFAPRQAVMEFVVDDGVVRGLKILGMGDALLPRHPES